MLICGGCASGLAYSSTVSATSATGLVTPTTLPPGLLHWLDCKGGFQCANLAVPLDYNHPDGAKLQLALIRLTARKPQERIGALLTNPGGPGVSGVDFVRDNAFTSEFGNLRDRFDIVGFDPRGTGRSSPINCRTKQETDADIASTPASPDVQFDIHDAQSFDQECSQKDKALLPYLSTEDSARDMEQLRIALGEPAMNYLGFSYGTYLGATYASLFPDHIRTMVLDGAVDPTDYTTTPFHFDSQQIQAFEVALQRFFTYCKATPRECNFGHGDPSGEYSRLLTRLEDHPIPSAGHKDTRLVRGSTLETAALISMYSRSAWPILALGLHMADAQNDGSVLQMLADQANNRHRDGSYDPGDGAFYGISCLDRNYPRDISDYTAQLKQAETLSPHFGALTSGFNCAYWPMHADEHYSGPFHYTATHATPLLVLGTTHDPATPYQDAEAMVQQLGNAVLLTKDGDGHTAIGDTPCIDTKVYAYLTSLTIPAHGTVCPQKVS